MSIFEKQDKTQLSPWAKASLIDSAIQGKHVTNGGNGSNYSPDVSFPVCPGGGVMANSIWNRSKVCALLFIRFHQVYPFCAMIWKYTYYKLVSTVIMVKKKLVRNEKKLAGNEKKTGWQQKKTGWQQKKNWQWVFEQFCYCVFSTVWICLLLLIDNSIYYCVMSVVYIYSTTLCMLSAVYSIGLWLCIICVQ